MANLCRACQTVMADRGGVCYACRFRFLKDPVPPTARPGVWILAALCIILLSVSSSLIGAAVMLRQTPRRSSAESPSPLVAYEMTMVVAPQTRKVFPYSIVPGGAQNLDEAKQAMNDPAVKANYAGVDFTKLRQVKLTRSLSGYVSYRAGEKIYWTAKMLTLRPGEMVFTDGVYLVRGRCLNSYSPRATLPVWANEPSEEALDTPVEMPVVAYSIPKLASIAPPLPPSPESLTPAVPIFPPSGLVPIIPPLQGRAP
jgi:hypothetical protein